ncbi:MAG TPA: hypothetical protein VFK03_02495, partial [Candidatus Saccharimonadales bacterium]|nr:hypothetical protein [Candidatus Saccharimonadales bacterium]
MEHKRKGKLVNRYTLGALVVAIIAIAATTTLYIQQQNQADAEPSASSTSTLPQKTPGQPQFTFIATPGWRQGPTDKISMALFPQKPDGCFVSFEHKAGVVDVKSELKNFQKKTASLGYSIELLNSMAMKLPTNDGPRDYQLYQYSVSGTPGGRKA